MRLFRRDRRAAPFEHREMQLEEIESRILHSADLAPIALSEPVGQVEMRIVDTAPSALDTKSQQTTTHEVVFVDAAIPDYRQ
ncbi:MAG: LEPR-XLL domain-containing protein, partial [Burkholderiales bacterium]